MAKPKATLTAAEFETLPEAARDFYEPDGESYKLAADGLPDFAGLSRAKENERAETNRVRRELNELRERFKDLDPIQAREALEKLRGLEEKDLIKSGDLDQLWQKRLAPIQRGHQSQMEALQQQLKAAEEKYAALSETYTRTMRSKLITDAAAAEHVDPDWYEYVDLKAQHVWRLNETGALTAYGPDNAPLYGQKGEPLTPGEWIRAGLAKDKPKLLLASNGSGAPGGGQRAPSGNIRLTREQTLDLPTYLAAKERAAKLGVEVESE